MSRVRSLVNGGEAVSLSVVTAFQENLAPYGLKKNVVLPIFGMAEQASIITYPPAGEPSLRSFSLDRGSLEGVLRTVPSEHPRSIVFMGLGKVIPGVSIRIADKENKLLPENRVGRLHIKGKAVSPGYYK
ncbi:MAG: AMP-binding protein, partial [Gammaproteobacteria bacterium]|nr:AMP-binding protein [Gammaproteobacteria bacterium]